MSLPPAVPKILGLVPTALAELVGQQAFARVIGAHPRLLDRMGTYADSTFAFAPSDIPFEFAVMPRTGVVRAVRPGKTRRYDVRVSGPVVLLLALAEGRVDGDAEFFGRQIAIEGDMEAMLALRNALENEAIDFTRDLAPKGRLARRPVEAGLARLRTYLMARENRRWN
jgi:predicted lipid carrier protein YhbT